VRCPRGLGAGAIGLEETVRGGGDARARKVMVYSQHAKLSGGLEGSMKESINQTTAR